MSYDDRTRLFTMNCFADCKLPHPLELLRLGGDKNWKRLGEKMLEYRTNMDKNRCICPLPNCGAILDGLPPISEKKVVECLTCHRQFCRHCTSSSIL